MESINLKEYFESRFKIDKPYVYVSGKNTKIPIDIKNLFFIINESLQTDYSMATDNGQTIETIQFDGLTIELYSDKAPADIMEDTLLKSVLKIAFFTELNLLDKLTMKNLFIESGFKIHQDKIINRKYPYTLSKNKDYFVVKYPILISPEELSEDIKKMENVSFSSTNENIIQTTPLS